MSKHESHEKNPKTRLVTLANAPRRMPDLSLLPRSLRYRLAIEAGLRPDSPEEIEFRTLPAIQQASVLARLLKEHDHDQQRGRK